MLEIENISVWIERKHKKIFVTPFKYADGEYYRHPKRRGGFDGEWWCDPIGAAYMTWRKTTDEERVRLMIETAIDLAMDGFDLGDILREYAQVRQFRALGDESYPMCRALTTALVGQRLEPNTMSFEELLRHYAKEPA